MVVLNALTAKLDPRIRMIPRDHHLQGELKVAIFFGSCNERIMGDFFDQRSTNNRLIFDSPPFFLSSLNPPIFEREPIKEIFCLGHQKADKKEEEAFHTHHFVELLFNVDEQDALSSRFSIVFSFVRRKFTHAQAKNRLVP